MKDITKGYENNSKVNQNQFFDKTGIGYKKNTNEASSSMLADNKRSQEGMQKLSRTTKMKKRSNVSQNNPYQKKGHQKDQILENHLLHMFPGMDTSFMGIALHVEDLDTKL